jgi:hypothetical protein
MVSISDVIFHESAIRETSTTGLPSFRLTTVLAQATEGRKKSMNGLSRAISGSKLNT